MAPILLNVAASVASNLIDNISDHLTSQKAKKKDDAGVASFASALAQAQAPTLADRQAALTGSLMSCSEVKAALATANPSQPVQLEISAAGGVSLRGADGSVRTLNVSESTRATATQLYGVRQAGGWTGTNAAPAVLAVDPAHAASPVWSTLPARV